MNKMFEHCDPTKEDVASAGDHNNDLIKENTTKNKKTKNKNKKQKKEFKGENIKA